MKPKPGQNMAAARKKVKEAIWLAKLFEELNIPNIAETISQSKFMKII